MNQITATSGLFTERSNSYLRFDTGAFKDVGGAEAVAVADGSATLAENFVDDSTDPRLISFILNLRNNTLTLAFSETVQGGDVTESALTLVGTDSFEYDLNGATTASFDGLTEVVISLSVTDRNTIKNRRGFAVNTSTASLAVGSALEGRS